MVRELGSEETLEILRARVPVLERHHDVVIHESALAASVRLTDLFMPDRRRPDRALDVLDEACAHAQGAARLTPAVEELARERRILVREGPSRRENVADDMTAGARAAEPGEADTLGLGPDVRLELPEFARDGFAALERLGGELGALFDIPGAREAGDSRPPHETSGAGETREAVERHRADEEHRTGETHRPDEERGTDEGRGAGTRRESTASSGGSGGSGTSEARQPARRTLAELEEELRAKLVEEGAVVRGHDIARVMTLITGKQISWVD